MLHVASSVVFCQDLIRFGRAVFGYESSRALGHPPEEGELDEREPGLQDRGDAPAHCRLVGLSAEGRPIRGTGQRGRRFAVLET